MSSKASILVVEDESIIAMDIQFTLQRLGYKVLAVVPSGELAIQRVAETLPDLVLMDIVLQGALDGIQAAAQIRERFGTPVVYLTAHSDAPTLERAKVTEPLGYLIKPFEEHDLRSTIEMALYRHAMERKLQESERWLATTLQSISEGVIATDPQGHVRLLNGVAEALMGCTQTEAQGKPLWDRLTIHPAVDVGGGTEDLIRKTLMEGAPVRPAADLTLTDRQGKEKAVEISIDPIRGPDGNRLGAVVVFRDVAQRRRLEEQAQQARKLAAVGYLAGGVAHDFNNLLTVINGFSELLLADVAMESSSWVPLREIRKAGERAATLTHQLLAFGRKQMLTPVTLDLNAILAELESLLRRLLGEDIDLELALDPHLGMMRADSGQLEQVLLNLVVNAREAMPAGGKLTLATSNVEVGSPFGTSSLDIQPGPYVLLTVRDTGCGMTEEVQSHLFEPFFTTKESGQGSGLGLATVYGIIKQSGGHLEVDSAVGQGTTFRIYLRRSEGRSPAGGSDPSSSVAGGTETVLLVEDEEPLRRLARLVLATRGYHVLEAADGIEALRVSDDHQGRIDILVTDVVMPHLGGRQLADRLTAQRSGLKVLYLSGYSADTVMHQGVQEGSIVLLSKPFTPAALARKVREVLDR